MDLYHAREHLHDLANLAARLLAGHRDDWLATRLKELDAGNTDAILAAGRDLNFTGSLAAERDKALAYFEHNAHRMRYQHFKSLGMFVGSGVVEAGCKSVIGQIHRAAPETIRHALDPRRRDRHRHPALPGRQPPLGRDLAAATRPDGTTPPRQPGELILLPAELAHIHGHLAGAPLHLKGGMGKRACNGTAPLTTNGDATCSDSYECPG